MADSDGAVFTFDTRPFEESLQKMERGLSKTASAMANMGKTITTSINNAASKAIGTVMKLTAGFLSINAALKAMPIVGKSFEVMKDVITRNLFWPLQKQILPLLQKMLDWVTSHRTTFVKWGEVIANIFKVVLNVATQLYGVFKKLADVAGDMLRDAFGVESLDEFMNLMVVKIHFILMFLGYIVQEVVKQVGPGLTQIADTAGKIIKKVIEWATELGSTLIDTGAIEAFATAFGKLADAAARIVLTTLDNMVDWIRDIVIEGNKGANLTTFLTSIGDLATKLGDIGEIAIQGFWDGFKAGTQNLMPILQEFIDMLNVIFGTDEEGLTGINNAARALGAFLGGGLMFALAGVIQLMGVLAIAIRAVMTLFTGDWAGMVDFTKQIGTMVISAGTHGNEAGLVGIKAAAKAFGVDLDAKDDMMESSLKPMGETPIMPPAATFEGGTVRGAQGFGPLHKGPMRELFDNMGNLKMRIPAGSFINQREAENIPIGTEAGTVLPYMGRYIVNDAVITPQGDVIQTSPEDYIFATKRPESLAGGARGDISVQFGDINVTCTEGDAQVTGERFALAFANEFADKVAQQLYIEGAT